VNLPSHQSADPRLSHAEQFGRLPLCEAATFDQLAKTDHEVSPHSQILGFGVRKPEVTENIAGRTLDAHEVISPFAYSEFVLIRRTAAARFRSRVAVFFASVF